ncbi:hypothetical protein X809_08885 [Paenibacillus polymyxa CR1]|nr:hypothetical protein PPE_03440 [Paenibacillus polymyxa E681]AHC19329.1 hypothetical protein X809_08885 [Paenibacillus polymyxa CR1]QNV58280.1 hypothetical protein GE561_03453 [Paenibacillus polymyxa E681]QNV63115.1 hypothetical protein GMA19_03451 [Paenibacillus polymyxa E681]
MNFYNNRVVQILSVILYPISAFIILSNGDKIVSWGIPAVIAILFCFLWKNVRHLMISNALLWILSVPIWLFLIEGGQGAEVFIASLPFIIPLYIFIVFLPEIIIVLIRNFLLNKFRR